MPSSANHSTRPACARSKTSMPVAIVIAIAGNAHNAYVALIEEYIGKVAYRHAIEVSVTQTITRLTRADWNCTRGTIRSARGRLPTRHTPRIITSARTPSGFAGTAR